MSSKNRLKQGTLFSFFTKKPKDVSITTEKKDSSKTNDVKKSDSVCPPEDCKRCSPRTAKNRNDDVLLLHVGTKIEILWPDDDEYYVATVKESMSSLKPPKHVVEYDDDGVVETLDLAEETWRHVQTNQACRQRDNVVQKQAKDTDKYRLVEENDFDYEGEEEGGEDDGFLVDSSDDEEMPRNNRQKLLSKKRRRLIKVIPCTATNTSLIDKSSRDSKRIKHSSTTISQEGGKESPSTGNCFSPEFRRFTAKIGSTKESAAATIGNQALVTPPPSLNATFSSKKNKHAAAKNNAVCGAGSTVPATGMFQDGEVNSVGTHVHNHLSFLYPPKLRDAKGNLYNSLDYDPRTLYLGPAEEAEICKLLQLKGGLTPASKQWWDIKSKYFDTILFFKTGKFYEIYNMDADIACRELNLVYMKGAIAHSGFPESAYGTMSGRLIDKGYKVARVEQTETPEQLAERKKKTSSGKKPQVVNREVSMIGTGFTPKPDTL